MKILVKSIKYRGWVCEHSKENSILSPTLICRECGGHLLNWYARILEKLKDFIPKKYKPRCCRCTFAKAYNMTEFCPVCGKTSLYAGWVGGNNCKPGFQCFSCGWTKQFTREKTVKKIKEYLSNLW